MGKMIQVRNVPEVLHRSLKARAATAGMSLSDYLLGEHREIAERPTLAEFRERLAALRITRYAPVLLLQRIWQLRQNLSAYDAA